MKLGISLRYPPYFVNHVKNCPFKLKKVSKIQDFILGFFHGFAALTEEEIGLPYHQKEIFDRCF